MPTIILNKATTNAAIPKVPVYGFYDDFNRADADAAGSTSRELKPWFTTYISPDTTGKLGIRGNAAALIATVAGANSAFVATVDANAANGTLRGKYTTSDSGLRMAARVAGNGDYLALVAGTVSMELRKYVAGVMTLLGTSNTAPAGKTLELRLAGTTVSVYADNVQVLGPFTVNEGATVTKHGVQCSTSAGTTARLDYLEFVPA